MLPGELSSQTYSVSRMHPEGFTFFKFYGTTLFKQLYRDTLFILQKKKKKK